MDKQPCEKDCPKRSCRCAETCEEWKAYTKKRNRRYLANAIKGIYFCSEPKKMKERKK